MDRFDEWNEVKKTLHNSTPKDIKIKIGSIYWVNVGQNVGCEIYGKGERFLRPVLVVNKIYLQNFMNAFLGVPLSSKAKNKSGFLYHKFAATNKKEHVALLGQARIFDAKRVSDFYKGKMLKKDFEAIREKLRDNIVK